MLPLTNRLHEIQAPHLMFWGGLDAHILPEHIDAVVSALKEAKKNLSMWLFLMPTMVLIVMRDLLTNHKQPKKHGQWQ